MEKAIKAIEELQAKQEDQTRLLIELARSLRIRELWPLAFSRGSVTSNVTGNPRRMLTFTIIQPGGGSRAFDLAVVPVELWGEQVIKDMEQLGANPKYKQILKEWKVKK